MTEWVDRFCTLVESHSGIRLSASTLRRVEDMLKARAAEHGGGITEYLDRISDPSAAAELQAVINFLTVGKTAFWRYPRQIEAFADRLLPAVDRAVPQGESLRIWSAACATGEEPYTIAMALAGRGWFQRRPIEILGTDVNTDALEVARRGTYPARLITGLPARADRFFDNDGRTAVLDPEIAKRVTFNHLNLYGDAYPQNVHIVFCANVLIYFPRKVADAVVDRISSSMADDALLVVSPAETLSPHPDFRVIRVDNIFGYARGDWGGFVDRHSLATAAKTRARATSRVTTPPPASAGPAPARQRPPTPPPRTDVTRVRDLAASGDRDGAIGLALSLRSKEPDEPQLSQVLATLLFEARRFDEALAAFEDAIVADPLAFELYFYAGWIYRSRGDWTDAREAYRHALFLEPGFAFARYEFALCLHQGGSFEGAIGEYDKAEAAVVDAAISERLLRRAAAERDPFWNNRSLITELVRDNRGRAQRREPPLLGA